MFIADLIDDNIVDDVKCVLTIYKEHEGLSGNGFNAWLVHFLFQKLFLILIYSLYVLNLIWDYTSSIMWYKRRWKSNGNNFSLEWIITLFPRSSSSITIAFFQELCIYTKRTVYTLRMNKEDANKFDANLCKKILWLRIAKT